jgi:hypothetical protein
MVVDRVIGLTLAFVYIWNANHMQVEIVQKDVKFSNETDVFGIRAPTCHWPFPAMPYNQPIWFGLWPCSTMNHDVVWLFCMDCCESIHLLVGPPRLTSFVNRTHKNTVRFPFRLIRTACLSNLFTTPPCITSRFVSRMHATTCHLTCTPDKMLFTTHSVRMRGLLACVHLELASAPNQGYTFHAFLSTFQSSAGGPGDSTCLGIDPAFLLARARVWHHVLPVMATCERSSTVNSQVGADTSSNGTATTDPKYSFRCEVTKDDCGHQCTEFSNTP